jgi:transposase
MTKATRGRYPLEFKQEAVRLVESGQTMAAVSRSLGVVEQTLYNWVKAHRSGTARSTPAQASLRGTNYKTSGSAGAYLLGDFLREALIKLYST